MKNVASSNNLALDLFTANDKSDHKLISIRISEENIKKFQL